MGSTPRGSGVPAGQGVEQSRCISDAGGAALSEEVGTVRDRVHPPQLWIVSAQVLLAHVPPGHRGHPDGVEVTGGDERGEVEGRAKARASPRS